MKVTAEDFRRVYESMNDDALLSVNREELVEIAQQCYDAEVAKRGLDSVAPVDAEVPEEQASAEPTEEMVELATFADVEDARLARQLLKAAEIPANLVTDAALPGNIMGAAGGFRLLVPPDWLDQAREVLETQISDEELAAQAEAAGAFEEFEEEAEESKKEER